jgi:hypothetical protein
MKKIMTTALAAALLLSLSGFAAAEGNMGADRHLAKGIKCEMCHGAKNEVAFPNIDQCTKCHDPKQVAEKTKDVKPQNPHQSPHYGNTLDCALCHLQHSKPENYCAQCHSFDFKVK